MAISQEAIDRLQAQRAELEERSNAKARKAAEDWVNQSATYQEMLTLTQWRDEHAFDYFGCASPADIAREIIRLLEAENDFWESWLGTKRPESYQIEMFVERACELFDYIRSIK